MDADVPACRFSPGSLQKLVTSLVGRPCRVVFVSRLERRVVIVMQSRTLLLRPACSLLELLDGAWLMRPRWRRRTRRFRHACKVSAELVRCWVDESRRALVRCFSGLRAQWESLVALGPPSISWRHADVSAIGRGQAVDAGSIRWLPGVEVDGVRHDNAELCRRIEAGEIPLKTRDDLPGLPYLELPVDLALADGLPDDWEHVEQAIRRTEGEARDAAICMIDKSFGQEVEVPFDRRRSTGWRLDMRRLHDLHVGQRRGSEARVFVERQRATMEDYDPEKNLNILLVDLTSTIRDTRLRSSLAASIVAFLAQTCFELGGRTVLCAVSDRLLRLQSGRQVYVHSPVSLGESASCDELLARLYQARELALGDVHRSAWLPLIIDRVARIIEEDAEEASRRTIHVMVLSGRGLDCEAVDEELAYDLSGAWLAQRLKALEEAVPAHWFQRVSCDRRHADAAERHGWTGAWGWEGLGRW